MTPNVYDKLIESYIFQFLGIILKYMSKIINLIQ